MSDVRRGEKLAAVEGLDARADLASHLGFAFGRPTHQCTPDNAMEDAKRPHIFNLGRSKGDFKDAEVGDQETSGSYAAGALEMVPGLPTGRAQVLGACRSVGSAVVEDFGPIGPMPLLDGHEAVRRLGRHRQCKARPDAQQKGAQRGQKSRSK